MRGRNQVKPGVGIALSGGGFRATLFHIGALWRLNELGWFPKFKEVTSVSGGSIMACFLGLRWKKLRFNNEDVAINFQQEITQPLIEFCSHTIDIGSIVGGILLPFIHPSHLISAKYKKYLFGDATLQGLPDDAEGPRFTIYTSSLQTGASVRFSKPYLADYNIGRIKSPEISLAKVVAASSAFPPFLCPVILKFDPDEWEKFEGANLYEEKKLRSKLYLADGGIYDNLGLERIWDRYEIVLASDAGAPFKIKSMPRALKFSQLLRTTRTLLITSEQTRRLRRRHLIDEFEQGIRKGTFWGVATKILDYKLEENGLAAPMVSDNATTRFLSNIPTRLKKFSEKDQGQLINWGYALTDAAMRRYVLDKEVEPGKWPVPKFALQ